MDDMRRILCLLLLLAPRASGQDAVFTFQSGFWTNLHHFLYVLGRARNNTADSKREAVRHAVDDVDGLESLTKPELLAWDAAVSHYQQTLSTRDAIFDHELFAIARSMAEGQMNVPEPLRRILEAAAPVYRKVWWPRHDRANQTRIRELETGLRAHGAPIAEFLAATWHEHWPQGGRAVQVSAYANWAGAYSTGGGLIVVASTDAATGGSQGLETIFHEALHQWDDNFDSALRSIADRLKVQVPRTLLHSLIFYTAGFAVAREIPGHRPDAETQGVWERGLFPRARIEKEWRPYLEGKRSFGEAAEALLVP